MRARTWESVMPLQSSSSLILASISREGDSPLVVALFFILFAPHSAVFLSCEGTNHQSSAPAWRYGDIILISSHLEIRGHNTYLVAPPSTVGLRLPGFQLSIVSPNLVEP